MLVQSDIGVRKGRGMAFKALRGIGRLRVDGVWGSENGERGRGRGTFFNFLTELSYCYSLR